MDGEIIWTIIQILFLTIAIFIIGSQAYIYLGKAKEIKTAMNKKNCTEDVRKKCEEAYAQVLTSGIIMVVTSVFLAFIEIRLVLKLFR